MSAPRLALLLALATVVLSGVVQAQAQPRLAVELHLALPGPEGSVIEDAFGVGARVTLPLRAHFAIAGGLDDYQENGDDVCVIPGGATCVMPRALGGLMQVALERRFGDSAGGVLGYVGAGGYASWWQRAEADDGRLAGAPIGPLVVAGVLVQPGGATGFVLRAEGATLFSVAGKNAFVPRIGLGWRF